MSSNPTLTGAVSGAERFFCADVLALALKGRNSVGARAQRHAAGGIEVLARNGDTQWIVLDEPQIRAALNNLSTSHPGFTIQCEHLLRVDELVHGLARNEEAQYDDCLLDAVLQMALVGQVKCAPPPPDSHPADTDTGLQSGRP